MASLNNGLRPQQTGIHRTPLRERGRALAVIGRPTRKSHIRQFIANLDEAWTGGPITVHLVGSDNGPSTSNSAISYLYHGYLERAEDVQRVLSKCRLAVYPGSVGLSLIEAMQAGLPTLLPGPAYEHMPEIAAFIDGETGLYYPPGEPVRMAEVLQASLEDDDWLDAAHNSSIRRGLQYTTTIMSERMIRLIDRVLSSRRC